MSKIQNEIELLAPDQLGELVDQLAARFDLDEEREYTKEELDDLFRYVFGCISLEDHETASKVLGILKPAIDRFRKKSEDPEPPLNMLTDWSILAIRFMQESKEDFLCMPIYREVFAAFEGVPEKLQYKKGQFLLQMVNHYRYWQNKGGDPDNLEEEDRDFLDTAEENFQEECDQILESCEEREDWDNAVALKRSLYRFYLGSGKPNDAIGFMKELVEDLPKTTEYHPADLADLYQELGKTFMQYKKYPVSLKYFEMAKEIYEGDEELELFAMQAEGWIDQCKKLM